MRYNPSIAKQVRQQTGVARKPNNSFYLSLAQDITHPGSNNTTIFSEQPIPSINILQTSFSTLFKDFELKNSLGKSSSNVTIYNSKTPTSNNLYNTTVSTEYRLPNGTIGVSHTPNLQKFTDFYGLPYNQVEIAPIAFGTGKFLNRPGFVAIVTGDTTTKLILVYFTNK